jgi:hypothetical protein
MLIDISRENVKKYKYSVWKKMRSLVKHGQGLLNHTIQNMGHYLEQLYIGHETREFRHKIIWFNSDG